MATEIVDKKKNVSETVVEDKSKGLNTLLWILVAVFFAAAAMFISKKYIHYLFV